MKPKHRIYCREFGRSKLLFESESKALNFIKFNSEDILKDGGKAPNRAYYCECCGGYHVTSIKKPRRYNRVNYVIKAYNKDKEIVLNKC